MKNMSLMYSDVGSASELYYSNKGIIFPINDLYFKRRSSLDEFFSILNEKYNIDIIDINGSIEYKEIISDNFRLIMSINDEMFNVWGKCINNEIVKELYKIYSECVKNEHQDLNILLHSYYLENNRICYSENLICDEFSPKKCYIPYIDTDEMFHQFFKGSENIMILVGKSGIGKSKLSSLGVKWLSDNCENTSAKIAAINDTEILAREEFWQSIKNVGIDLVLLDDLDFMLNSRTDERSSSDVIKNKFLSYFLTFTDGFRKNNIKFIITTNQDYKDIDKAIIRKGRLFDVLELRELNYNEAKEICKIENINDDFLTKKSITAADLAYEIELRKNHFESKEYLKDKSVSRKTNISKKIGF